LLARNGGIDPVILRLSNVYGPRMALNITCQGFLSVYLRRALLGQALDVFGDGSQIRDPVYIDDVVDAFLRVGMSSQPPHRTYNVGGSEQLSMERIATMISRVSGGVAVVRRPFPESRKQIDIGSYYSDTSRLRDDLAWRCNTPFKVGLTQTFDFYRSQICEYLDVTNTEQQCSWCDARKEPLNRKPALAS
jgi:UDP-glucose 4-epimerase